jgi:hypothetical protein
MGGNNKARFFMGPILTLFTTLFFIPTVWADTIYVAPVQGTNISDQQSETLRELIKVEVQNSQTHRLAPDLKSAEFFIQTKVIKLSQYTLSMTRWQGDKKVNSGQWKANSIAELESQIGPAVAKVVSGGNKTSAGQATVFGGDGKTLGERAREKQARSSNERVQARRQVLIGFGPAYFSKMNDGSSGLGFQAGYIWNVDDHWDLGLQTDFSISTEHSDAYVLSGRIFTSYLFTTGDISPYIGAGFGYGWASVHNGSADLILDDAAGGFAVSAHAGVKFFRTSTVNFVVGGEFTQIFDKSSLGRPGVFLFKVGLLY